MQAKLHICVLGSPAVTLDGNPVTGWTSSKVAALLYYLAATGRVQPREALIDLLWETSSIPQAQQSVRGALFTLRKLLEPFLTITRQSVGLDPSAPVTVDLEQFQQEVQAARDAAPDAAVAHLQRAAALYAGDFLDGFWVSQAPQYEAWMLGERERLRQLAQSTFHTLTTNAIRRGAYADGIEYTSRILKMDPWQEEAHRQLMYLLAVSGQRGAALAQYERCRHALQDELGIDPSEETTDLYRRILDGEVAAPAQNSAPEPATRPRHNLPIPATPFIGRERDRAALTAYLRDRSHRVLTLIGPGGIGKTRLALEAVEPLVPTRDATSPFQQGVFVVSLAALAPREPLDDMLAAAIAADLDIPLSGPDAPSVQVINYLREKTMLLVLDNFEHVIAGAGFVARIVREAPGISVCVTSRARLNLRGEHTFALAGLPCPRRDADTRAIEDAEAVRLFVQTAQTISPDFGLTASNAPAIARICALVQGLPLGVELAAAWTRLMECDEIAAEIARSMDFLAAGTRDMPERHQSLRAVFLYSWNLLAPSEQHALRRLAVFRAPFTREAAAAIAGASLPMLARLLDTSLLRREVAANGVTRYELLDVLREFAVEHLEQAGEAVEVAEQYAAYYLDLLRRHTADLRGAMQQTALRALVAEIEHVRAAWDWAVEHADLAALRHAGPSLFHIYDMRSWFQEGAAVFGHARQRVASLPPSDDARLVHGMMLAREGWFTFHLGDQLRAQQALEHSLHLVRAAGGAHEIAFALNYLGAVCSYLGEYASTTQLCEESIAIAERIGDDYGRAIACNILAQAAYAKHDDDQTRHWSEQSLLIEQRLGNRWSMAYSLTNLGNVAYRTGALNDAQTLFEQSLAIREEMQDIRGVAICYNRLGDIAVELGDIAEARRRYDASLELCREIGNRWGIAAAFINLAQVATAEQNDREALHLLQQALRIALDTAAMPQLTAIFGALACLLRRNGEEAWAAEIAHLGVRPSDDIAPYLAPARRVLAWRARAS